MDDILLQALPDFENSFSGEKNTCELFSFYMKAIISSSLLKPTLMVALNLLVVPSTLTIL